MRVLLLGLVIACCFAAAPAAKAQTDEPPEIMEFKNQLSLGIGESRVLVFSKAFGTINVASKGIAVATAQTDRTMTLTGEAPGSTILVVYSDEGKQLYSALVIVTTEPGHVVRVYGRRDIGDYSGFYCTETFCGRVDKELAGTREPTGGAVTVRRPLEGGGFVETSKTYGR